MCNIASIAFGHRSTHHMLINVKPVEHEQALVIFAVLTYLHASHVHPW